MGRQRLSRTNGALIVEGLSAPVEIARTFGFNRLGQADRDSASAIS